MKDPKTYHNEQESAITKGTFSSCRYGLDPAHPMPCRHLRDEFYGPETRGIVGRCDAFPEGIPNDIYYGAKSHFESIPGDNGIVYEPERS